MKLSVGIDIGGTNTAFGLVDENGKIYAQGSVKTQTHEKVEDYANEVFRQIMRAAAQITEKPCDIVGVGIGAPNGNYYNGCIENAANLRWKGKVEIAAMFKKLFGKPVFLTNDANAAAIGEMVYGAAKGMKNFIEITLGTGLGSGIVVNGQLLYGHDGFAGEVGHIIVKPDGRDCGCGRKGCLETYVSATGVVRTATELLATRNIDSELRRIPNSELTALMVSQAAGRGDAIASEVFECTGAVLGRALADVTTITSPEAFIIFGGLAKAGDILLEPTRRHMEQNMLNMFKNKVKIIPSQLSDDAAILGASALVWNELSDK
ncbi:MAG: ROK family protein [Salinivirgaceae bacterium]|nr:ROK family protein [Salinivirgaceae bacterium]